MPHKDLPCQCPLRSRRPGSPSHRVLFLNIFDSGWTGIKRVPAAGKFQRLLASAPSFSLICMWLSDLAPSLSSVQSAPALRAWSGPRTAEGGLGPPSRPVTARLRRPLELLRDAVFLSNPLPPSQTAPLSHLTAFSSRFTGTTTAENRPGPPPPELPRPVSFPQFTGTTVLLACLWCPELQSAICSFRHCPASVPSAPWTLVLFPALFLAV